MKNDIILIIYATASRYKPYESIDPLIVRYIYQFLFVEILKLCSLCRKTIHYIYIYIKIQT